MFIFFNLYDRSQTEMIQVSWYYKKSKYEIGSPDFLNSLVVFGAVLGTDYLKWNHCHFSKLNDLLDKILIVIYQYKSDTRSVIHHDTSPF